MAVGPPFRYTVRPLGGPTAMTCPFGVLVFENPPRRATLETTETMDPLATIVERLCAWKDVNREKKDGKDSFFVRGQVFAYLGKKGVVVKLAPPQVTEALKIIGAKRMPDDGDPHSREFVEIPVTGPREVERAMMWLRRACRLGRTAAGPV